MILIRIRDRDLRYYADGEDAFSMRRELVPTTKVYLKKRRGVECVFYFIGLIEIINAEHLLFVWCFFAQHLYLFIIVQFLF
jgi:hypothetical protein